jgi:hypothetical protein
MSRPIGRSASVGFGDRRYNRLTTVQVGIALMGKRFEVGNHVTWHSEAGHVSGKTQVVTSSLPNDFEVRRVQAEQSMGFVKRIHNG